MPQFAPLTKRLVGQFVDWLVGAAPFAVGVALTAGAGSLGYVLMFGGTLWAVYYYLFADGFTGGRSVAKGWLNMRVVSENNGAPCTFGQSFARNALLILLGPIDWIFILGARRQRLGDKLAGTIVIEDFT